MINWEVVFIALNLMWKGMLGIFAVIFLIMLCIMLMNLLLVEKDNKVDIRTRIKSFFIKK